MLGERSGGANSCATIPGPYPQRGSDPSVNPLLAVGQLLVSAALVAAILLQSRGTGLSATFGGDSAVYRSRRGIERRLFQFTVLLAILFVLFALVAFVFAPATTTAR